MNGRGVVGASAVPKAIGTPETDRREQGCITRATVHKNHYDDADAEVADTRIPDTCVGPGVDEDAPLPFPAGLGVADAPFAGVAPALGVIKPVWLLPMPPGLGVPCAEAG